MNCPESPRPPSPPRPGLGRTLNGVWRLTYPGFFRPGRLLWRAGLLVLLALLTLAMARRPHGFFMWSTEFFLTSLVPLLAYLSAGGAIRDDMEALSADYVFTRPVSRPLYVACKYLAHLAGVQLYCLLALGVVLGIGAARHVPGLADAFPLLLLTQVLAVAVYTAAGFLVGSLTSRYLVAGIVYAGVVEIGIGAIPTQINQLSLLHHLRGFLKPLQSPLFALGEATAALPTSSATSIALLLLATLAMLVVAAGVFRCRELTGAPPKDS